MKHRLLEKQYANRMGYFWLPCPLCGIFFGGHEWKNGDEYSIPIKNRPGFFKGICPDCGNKRKKKTIQMKIRQILKRLDFAIQSDILDEIAKEIVEKNKLLEK